MVTPLSTLITSRSQSTILSAMYSQAASLGVDVTGVQSERLFRALYEIESRAKSTEEVLRVLVAKGGLLDYVAEAGDAWVDLLAAGFFNLTRNPALQTQGYMLLNGSPLAVPANYASGTVIVSDDNGVTFKNLDAFNIVPGQFTVPVLFQAVNPGVSGNVPNSTVRRLVTTIAGVRVVNPAYNDTGTWITRSGTPPESNSSLISRCRARWASTGYGLPAAAYIIWVNEAFVVVGQTSTVTRIGIDDTNPNGPGSTDLYLANASGPATVAEIATVDDYLQPRRQTGSGPLRDLAAPAFNVAVAATIYGTTDSAAATAAIQNFFATLDLGSLIRYPQVVVELMKPKLPGAIDLTLTLNGGTVDIQIPTGNVPVPTPITLSFVA